VAEGSSGRRGQGPDTAWDLPSRSTRELKALQTLKRDHAMLKEEHELLKTPSGSLPHEGGDLRVHRRPTRECPAPAGPAGDITYLKVGRAWRYLAVVMDRYSRRIIGWSLGASKDARLTLAAFNHAVRNRRPRPGVIFHSDRGIEYAAHVFRQRLATLGFVQSMNRPREITYNAYMESFFHSMKSDTVHGCIFTDPAELEQLLRRYIPYYNGVRLHSGIGYSSPVDYETRTK
jgi:transposase InsO family protein